MKQKSFLSGTCLRVLKADVRLYGLVLLAFLTGSVMAAVVVFGLPETAVRELQLYIDDFFHNMNQSGANSVTLFKTGLHMHALNFGLLLLFSVMVIGTPFVAAFSALKGFMHCFTLFFMFRLYSLRAALFFLLGMLPHYLILIPCYSVLCVACLKLIASLREDKRDLKMRLFRFLPTVLLLFLAAVTGTLLQAYVEPVLIRLISGMFIS